jgi:hypothetical protein
VAFVARSLQSVKLGGREIPSARVMHRGEAVHRRRDPLHPRLQLQR